MVMPFELRLQKVSWRKGKSIPGMDADCNGTELSPRVALRVGVRAGQHCRVQGCGEREGETGV